MRHLGISTQNMVIHQYHFSVTPGDAVTNQMFFIKKSLEGIGITSHIFSDHIRGGLSKWIHRLNEIELWNCDLLVIHHSHGNPQLAKLLNIEVPKALIYHNITPETYFRHDPLMWNLCRIGQRQLLKLRESVAIVFSDSHYNAIDLKKLGFNKPILFPLFDLKLKMANASSTSRTRVKSTSLLFVGKICRRPR